MRRSGEKSSNPPPSPAHGDRPEPGDGQEQHPRQPHEPAPNAFSAEFLEHLRTCHEHPATPDATNAGPWQVDLLPPGEEPSGGARNARWLCMAAGEAEPRAFLEHPDSAYLMAAALPLTGHGPRFSLAEALDCPGGFYWVVQGRRDLGVVRGGSDELTIVLDVLDALRRQPLALAHFLLAVGDETLERTGRILVDLAPDLVAADG